MLITKRIISALLKVTGKASLFKKISFSWEVKKALEIQSNPTRNSKLLTCEELRMSLDS